jgi:hypothetical protein
MTLAQLDPSAKAPWTNTTFFTVDLAAATRDWSAPAVRIEAKQMDNVSSIADRLITVLCSLLGPPCLVLIVLMSFSFEA